MSIGFDITSTSSAHRSVRQNYNKYVSPEEEPINTEEESSYVNTDEPIYQTRTPTYPAAKPATSCAGWYTFTPIIITVYFVDCSSRNCPPGPNGPPGTKGNR